MGKLTWETSRKFDFYAKLRGLRQEAGFIALKQAKDSERERWEWFEWELNKLECKLEGSDMTDDFKKEAPNE